jgi:hypothetical protein
MFLAFLFYDAEHWNLRFIIAVIFASSMLNKVLVDVLLTCTRTYCGITDYRIESLSWSGIDVITQAIATFCLIRRDWLVNAVCSLTGINRRHRMLKVDYVVILIHLIFEWFCYAYIYYFEMQTDFNDRHLMWDAFAEYSALQFLYWLRFGLWFMLLLAIQSYNYEAFYKRWFIKA